MQADSPKMENGLKCLKAIVYYAFPVKCYFMNAMFF